MRASVGLQQFVLVVKQELVSVVKAKPGGRVIVVDDKRL